jgi:hypothetical protein
MVYAADSKSAAFTGLRVQVSSPALSTTIRDRAVEERTWRCRSKRDRPLPLETRGTMVRVRHAVIVGGAICLGVLVCGWPARAFARKTSAGFYLEVRGDESIRRGLEAKLESLPCFEEADLHSTDIYETTSKPGGECHAFRRFRKSSTFEFPYLLRIALKDSVRGGRSFTLTFYELRGREFERSFESGTFRYPDARFVEEAANQIAIRTFMLPPPPSRGHRESASAPILLDEPTQ